VSVVSCVQALKTNRKSTFHAMSGTNAKDVLLAQW